MAPFRTRQSVGAITHVEPIAFNGLYKIITKPTGPSVVIHQGLPIKVKRDTLGNVSAYVFRRAV